MTLRTLIFVRRGVFYCNAVAIPLPSLGVSSLDLGRLQPRAALFLLVTILQNVFAKRALDFTAIFGCLPKGGVEMLKTCLVMVSALALLTSFSVSAKSQTASPAPGDCQPWQYRDNNGNCVDRPEAQHHAHGHAPEAGEKCWEVTKCMCRIGTHPAAPSCAPCSYNGTEVICIK